MDYKDTRLDKGRQHNGSGQVKGTNIQDNWTSQDDNTLNQMYCSLRQKMCVKSISDAIMTILFRFNIVDEGVMKHLIPNKQCLFLSFSSYICLPYPHS